MTILLKTPFPIVSFPSFHRTFLSAFESPISRQQSYCLHNKLRKLSHCLWVKRRRKPSRCLPNLVLMDQVNPKHPPLSQPISWQNIPRQGPAHHKDFLCRPPGKKLFHQRKNYWKMFSLNWEKDCIKSHLIFGVNFPGPFWLEFVSRNQRRPKNALERLEGLIPSNWFFITKGEASKGNHLKISTTYGSLFFLESHQLLKRLCYQSYYHRVLLCHEVLQVC